MTPIHLISAFALTMGLANPSPLPQVGLFTSSTALEVKQEVIKPPEAKFRQIRAAVTGYTPESSCKLSVKNPNCLMASGKRVYEGAVACPYFLKLGTKVRIWGRTFTCEDRYAKWLDEKRGMPTFDIFTFGKAQPKVVVQVEILN